MQQNRIISFSVNLLGLSFLQHQLGHSHSIYVYEQGAGLAVRGQVHEDLIGSNWGHLHLFFTVHQLYGLLVIAEWGMEVALHVNFAFVDVLGHWATGDENRTTERAVTWHIYTTLLIQLQAFLLRHTFSGCSI